ncbi:MAG: L,D-transpeptidase family protein [Proteobacteria bacterium]|nr:L,D-transpeptidase family protein [Pseudomonadota bacterium]
MLQKFITSACTAALIGCFVLPARADDGAVVTSMLATLYGPAGEQRHDEALRDFYVREDYLPVWWRDGAWTQQAREALGVLDRAQDAGLNPTRYGAVMLKSAMEQDFAAASGIDAIADTEIALTAALLAYIRDSKNGLADPLALGWHSRRPEAVDAAALLAEGLRSGALADWLAHLAPERDGYAALREQLDHFRAMALLPWPTIDGGESIHPGDSDTRLPELRARLVMLGDLASVPGWSLHDVARFTHDEPTVAAVERFQRRHGLETDGIVGSRTLAQINVSPGERAGTIVANLEKLRWMPASERQPGRHVEVNVAGFELVAYEDGQPVLNMPVIVGEAQHPTPIISDRIVNLKFAPNWTVPFKITKNELLPKIQADPTWLAANDYILISDWGRGFEIDPMAIDWSRETPQTWSYMLQQKPGPYSALGLIRFSLTNPQDIYLHDTGSRNLFARANRGLSHGCVRVGDPLALAGFVLEGESQPWDRERIEAAMHAEDTDYHRLEAAVPVDFFYVTAWVDGDGHMQFRRDLYGLDAMVLAALEAASEPVIDLPLLLGAEDHPAPEDVALSGSVDADLPL